MEAAASKKISIEIEFDKLTEQIANAEKVKTEALAEKVNVDKAMNEVITATNTDGFKEAKEKYESASNQYSIAKQ